MKRAKRSAAVVAVLLGVIAPASADARPTLHDGAEGFKVRPDAILVSGDGTGWLGGAGADPPGDYGRIHWTAFRRSGARGHGRVFVSDCEPDCAGGTFSSWRAVIRAARVRKGHYTRLSAAYERDGTRVVDRWKLVRASRTYAYWLALP